MCDSTLTYMYMVNEWSKLICKLMTKIDIMLTKRERERKKLVSRTMGFYLSANMRRGRRELLERLLCQCSDIPLVQFIIGAHLDCCIEIGRWFYIRIAKHRDYRHDDCFHRMYWWPTLWGILVAKAFGIRMMKYGDANHSVWGNVWMPHFRDETHRWWIVGIVVGKAEFSLEEATLVQGVPWAHYHHFPNKNIALIHQSNTEVVIRFTKQLPQLFAQHQSRFLISLWLKVLAHRRIVFFLFEKKL